jgi:hypothetical protein
MMVRALLPRAFAATAIASALAVMLGSTAGTASASHEDCALTSGAPISFYGSPNALATATVECGTVKNWVRVSLVLTRDGTVVDTSDRMCHKRSDCWTYLVAPDPPGDQVWCAQASGRVGSHAIAEIKYCETSTEI